MTSSTSSQTISRPRARAVAVDAVHVRVVLEDDREIAVPLEWFGWLKAASNEQRRKFRIIEGGKGIWWDDLEDGISVPWLFGLPEYP
jgi:Protein of unknown function (DUF2442)